MVDVYIMRQSSHLRTFVYKPAIMIADKHGIKLISWNTPLSLSLAQDQRTVFIALMICIVKTRNYTYFYISIACVSMTRWMWKSNDTGACPMCTVSYPLLLSFTSNFCTLAYCTCIPWCYVISLSMLRRLSLLLAGYVVAYGCLDNTKQPKFTNSGNTVCLCNMTSLFMGTPRLFMSQFVFGKSLIFSSRSSFWSK